MMRITFQTMLLASCCGLLCSLPAVSLQAAPAADLWPFWQPQEVREELVFDHRTWQQLLDRYRVVGDRQMAYWINLYNALTVQVVLANPETESILRMGRGLFSFGPWNDEVASVAGQTLTLNDIEHRILRPIWRDRRIHFAVNCASLGCPDLSARAYTGENLERQLAQAELNYLNHPRGVSFSAKGGLIVSSIFDWYLEDFAADRSGLLRYLAQRHAREGERLLTYSGRILYQYDWSLNAVLKP